MLNGRDKLPETAVADIKQLIAGVSDKKERYLKRIYQYMQGKTRYVNIALGIGGFQPIGAQDVHKYGYGDCKALSNYTKSLLQIAGIEAFYTEIGQWRKANQPNRLCQCQPSQSHYFVRAHRTRHHLVRVYKPKSTILGFIGPGNADRYALAITPQGGKLVRTPSYTAQDNLENLIATNSILSNGDLSFSASLLLNNLAYSDASGLLTYSPKKQKEILVKSLPLNNLSISNLTIADNSSATTVAATLNFWHCRQICFISRKQIVCSVSPFHKTSQSFPANKERANDIFIETGSTQTDTLNFLHSARI